MLKSMMKEGGFPFLVVHYLVWLYNDPCPTIEKKALVFCFPPWMISTLTCCISVNDDENVKDRNLATFGERETEKPKNNMNSDVSIVNIIVKCN